MTLAEMIAEDRAVNPNGRSFLLSMAEEMLRQSARLDELEARLKKTNSLLGMLVAKHRVAA